MEKIKKIKRGKNKIKQQESNGFELRLDFIMIYRSVLIYNLEVFHF